MSKLTDSSLVFLGDVFLPEIHLFNNRSSYAKGINEKPIRILQVLGRTDRGGAETMIMNIFRNIDRSLVKFDFVVHTQDVCSYDNEIKELGGIIYNCPRYKGVNHLSYSLWWKNFFLNHPEYYLIHSHIMSVASIILGIANKYDRITISHSHTTSVEKGNKFYYLRSLIRFPLRWRADYKFACSISAGEFLYGKKGIKRSDFFILNNSILAKSFIFNLEKSNLVKTQLGMKNQYVIGHIGSFQKVKNHVFIIEIFKELKKLNPNSILLLVGDGPLRKEIETKVERMGISDSVKFTGVRSDIPDLLQAMDVFLFPSLYEGLPVTMIEAQASGLPCVISDTISPEVKITDNVEFISLDKSPKYWAERVLSYQKGFIRKDTSSEIIEANYDIVENAKMMQEFYLSLSIQNQ